MSAIIYSIVYLYMTSLCRLFYCIKKYVLKTVEVHINAKA